MMYSRFALYTFFIGITVFSCGIFGSPVQASTGTNPVQINPTGTGGSVTAYEYEPNTEGSGGCTGAHEQIGDQTQFLFVPTNAGARANVTEIYFYFHGKGNSYRDRNYSPVGAFYTADKICSDYPAVCPVIEANQNIAVVAIRRSELMHTENNTHNDWFDDATAGDINCIIQEAQSKLQSVGVAVNGVSYNLAGHSAGGKAIEEWTEKASAVQFSRSIFLDATYGSWGANTVRNTNRGLTIFYARASQSEFERACIAAQRNSDNVVLVAYNRSSHAGVGTDCFADHMNGFSDTSLEGRCNGNGTIRDPAAPSCGATAATVGTLPSTVSSQFIGTTAAPFDASMVNITLPRPQISIPGLRFSPADTDGLTQTGDDGAVYINIPFLGEYLAAMYRFAIAAGSIIAVIIIIVSGIQMMLPGNIVTKDKETTNQAKSRIVAAITGLLLAIGSYTILFIVNPELVRFNSFKVQVIAPIGIDSAGYGDELHRGIAGGNRLGGTNRNWQNITGELPQIVNRELLVPDPENFCFPLDVSSYRHRSRITWGQARTAPDLPEEHEDKLLRCHAGADLLVEDSGRGFTPTNNVGTVYAMTDSVVTGIITRFTQCQDGKSSTSNPGQKEDTYAIVAYDETRDLTYVYGEINKNSVRVSEGDRITTGDVLGRATKCGMLHLEIYQGRGRERGSGGSVYGVNKPEGWYLYDHLAPPGSPQPNRWNPIETHPLVIADSDNKADICAEQTYINILDRTGSTLLDPRAFLTSILANDCAPGSGFAPGGRSAGGSIELNTRTSEPTSCTYTIDTIPSGGPGDGTTVSKPYASVTDDERFTSVPECTLCREDQVEVDPRSYGFSADPIKVCWKFENLAKSVLEQVAAAGDFDIDYMRAYAEGLKSVSGGTRFSQHAFGAGFDINRDENGLYNSCPNAITGNTTAALPCPPTYTNSDGETRTNPVAGGAWDPDAHPRLSITPNTSVYRAFKDAGFYWGGEMPGSQRDIMQFSPVNSVTSYE